MSDPGASRLDTEHPWPGLDSFSEGDTAYFHGRESETAELLRMLGRQTLTVLFGRSGLGKTSLLNAGLFPALREREFIPIYIRLDFSDHGPALRDQLFACMRDEAARMRVEAPQSSSSETLWEYFHRVDADFWDAKNRLVTPLLVFDQFEEAFSKGQQSEQGRARCQAFFTELGDLIENRTPHLLKEKLEKTPELIDQFNFGEVRLAVVLSFREDYLSDIEGLKATIPSITYNRFRLLPMNGAQAYAVITEAGGDLVDDDVARRVIRLAWRNEPSPPVDSAEFAQIEIDPALLSVVCSELNAKRLEHSPPLPRISASLLAGADREILAGFYQRSMRGQDPRVRAFVEDELLTDKGLRDSHAWDDALNLRGVTETALNELVERRLLRLDDRFGMRRLELTHDVLTGVVKESRDARQRRLQRLRLAYAGGAAAVMFCLVLVFASLWIQVIRQKSEILSQSLAAASRALLSTQGDLALLLAVEAREVAPTRQANELLLGLGSLIDPYLERYLPLGRLEAGPVAFSPDGKLLATASLKTILVWDLVNGRPIEHVTTTLKGIISGVAFGGPDKLFALVDGQVSVIAFAIDANGKSMPASVSPLGEVKGERLASNPDGTLLVLGGADGSVTLWDIAGGGPSHPAGGQYMHPDAITGIAFSPDGHALLSGDRDGTLVVWDVLKREPVGEPLRQPSSVTAVAFSRDGKMIAAGGADGSVRVWDVETRAENPRSPLAVTSAGVTALVFGADGRLAIGGSDGATILWDFASSSQAVERLTSPESAVAGLAYSRDGRMLARASGNAVALFSFSGDAVMAGRLVARGDFITRVAFSDDGKTLASTGEGDRMLLWDLTDLQKPSRQVPLGRGESPIGLVRDAQGWLIASWLGSPGELWLHRYAASGLTPLWKLKMSPSEQQPSASFGANGSAVAMATPAADGSAYEVVVVDAASGKPLREWKVTGRIALSPDGKVVALVSPPDQGSDKRSVRLVGVDTGQMTLCDIGPGTEPTPWAFSPDGKRLAVAVQNPDAGSGWAVVQCETTSGHAVGEPLRLDGLNDLAFAPPAGARIATASSTEPFVALWDANTGARIAVPFPSRRYRHDNWMSALAFSSDGARLAVANGEEVLLASPEGNRARACRIANRNLTGREWRTHLGDGGCRRTCPEFENLCAYRE